MEILDQAEAIVRRGRQNVDRQEQRARTYEFRWRMIGLIGSTLIAVISILIWGLGDTSPVGALLAFSAALAGVGVGRMVYRARSPW